MTLINGDNIGNYISFLYRKKYGTDIPHEVLESWRQLTDYDVNMHLNNLYQQWGISPAAVNDYENEFLSSQRKSLSSPVIPPLPAPPPVPVKKKGAALSWILLLIVIGVAGYFGFRFFSNQGANTKEVADTAKPKQISTLDVNTPKPKQVSEEEQAQDRANMAALNSLMTAENNRDFGSITAAFSPNMLQYWDIQYPTEEELSDRYQKAWSKTINNRHDNIRIEKVSKNNYNVFSTYSYTAVDSMGVAGEQKHVNSKVRYVFDAENKIIKAYGLK